MSKEIELHFALSDVFEQIKDDDLVKEVENRKLEGRFDNSDGPDEDAIREDEYKNLKKNNFVLPKSFDRFQLRDHLIDIAGLQSHVSDATLFNKLSDLLEFS